MKKILLFPFLLFVVTSFCFGQFSETFSDGNFSENPKWVGKINNFIVNSENQLQLNDEDFSDQLSQLVVPVETADSTNWSFYIKLEFGTSPSNFARVYISSNKSNLQEPLNGYFVKIGGVSGADDAFVLYKQSGTEEVILIEGKLGGAGSDPLEAWIKVKRNQAGKFELLVDYEGNGTYDSEGVYFDGSPHTGKYFGWVCKYTSSRKDKFFLDDILVDPVYVDEMAPKLKKAYSISATEVDILFDEAIGDLMNAEFTISNGITIQDAMIDDNNPNLIHLVLNQSLINGNSYTVTTNLIPDLSGNLSEMQTLAFDFIQLETPKQFDIIITEFLPDPTPSMGLPEVEFVEIYNRTDKNLSLSGLTISTGTPKTIGEGAIPAKSYLILCDEDDVQKFSAYDNVFGVDGMPGLTNSSDEIIIADESGNWIDQVEYFGFMYGEKDSDGISLERVNLNNICDFIFNWKASSSNNGGTPGSINAVDEVDLNFEALKIVEVYPIDDRKILLNFNKNINQNAFSNIDNIIFEPKISIQSIDFNKSIDNQLVITLSSSLQKGIVYNLELNSELSDCIGNPIGNAKIKFGLPQDIEKGDLVINEILFNPATGGTDFIELYNNSEKVLDLFGLLLSNESKSSKKEKVSYHKLLLPRDFIVMSRNILDIQERYGADLYKMINMVIPSFDDKEGNITISTENLGIKTIDSFDYEQGFHNQLIRDQNGVSLERINPNLLTQDFNNWHSAAESVGFATPTRKNSQMLEIEVAEKEFISLPYNTVSPDGDGFQDFLTIQYRVDTPGYVINAKIYNGKGQLIHNLFSIYGIGIQGSLKWDGVTSSGNKATSGVYILWVEFVLNNGTVKIEKVPFILAEKLN